MVADGSPSRASRSRSERRSKRRDERRRKMQVRLVGAVLILVVVAAAAAAFFIFLGPGAGDGDTAAGDTVPAAIGAQGAESSQQGVTASGSAPSAGPLVLLTDETGLRIAVVLQPLVQGGVALALPAATLMKTVEGFRTIAQVYASGDAEALATGVKTIIGTLPTAVGKVEVRALREAIGDRGDEQTPVVAADGAEGEVLELADALLLVAGLTGTERANDWDDLPFDGDVSQLREWRDRLDEGEGRGEIDGDGADSGPEWVAAVLPGSLVEGADFAYYEVDPARTGALLAQKERALDVVLQVQNGCGAIGAAEETGTLLASLGYMLTAYTNALGFPDVEETTISFAPGAQVAAERVRVALGLGIMNEDQSLEPGHIVVVVGWDLKPPVSGVSEEEGS